MHPTPPVSDRRSDLRGLEKLTPLDGASRLQWAWNQGRTRLEESQGAQGREIPGCAWGPSASWTLCDAPAWGSVSSTRTPVI